MTTNRIPTWLRAAFITSAQTFVASALVTLLGLLSEVQGWVDGGTAPDWSNAARLVVSAFVAFVAGLITAVHRGLVKPPEQTYTDARHA